MPASITDEALRSRLQKHNYPVPPITSSTRSVLLKKLTQLDAQNGPAKAKSASISGRRVSNRLLEYSSAEDEDEGPLGEKAVNTARPQRRVSNSSRNEKKNQSAVMRPGKVNGRSQRLMNYSEDEEENETQPNGQDDEESEEVEEEEEDDVDEEEGEEDDDDDEEGSEMDNDGDGRVDFGMQTSPGLDSTMEHSTLRSNGVHYRGNRFAASTPLSPPKSTAAFMNKHDTPKYSVVSPGLRRTIASNSKDFGSLGEALSTLPAGSTNLSSNSSNTRMNNSSANGSVVSQVSRSSNHNNSSGSTTSNNSLLGGGKSLSSSLISKLIIASALVFFVIVVFKYVNLRPSPNLADHIPICGVDHVLQVCVDHHDREDVMKLFQDMQSILSEQSVKYLCRNESDSMLMSFSDLTEQLKFSSPRSDLERLLSILIVILVEKPNWGIQLLDAQGQVISQPQHLDSLLLANPKLDWGCWTRLALKVVFQWLGVVSVYVLAGLILFGLIYGLYRLYVWRKEQKLQENQEVFELVEQVLSLLVAQHQVSRSQGPGGARPWVPVNHIRDQLIPPQDREKRRKKRIWSAVVKYINQSESRVRVDVQKVFAEEHAVWQWLPDIQWSPMNQHGPNPYLSPHSSFVHTPPASPMHNLPPVSTTPQWQGSAFSVLNRNVASPAVAPTSCVKVRHMFDSTVQKSGPGWVWQVKEEILRRCANQAKIYHVAVDKESHEGCVYIKCGSTDDAGSVFKTLHGQWYRGHLVTVKYLREERYHERFPDARFQKNPLKPQT
ncbi:hypothetical protein TCAL_03996 [Tigriopus californicus]|uniref:LEM domain-containing protein n=1 Tax=Tigriopus californicus TaxID=6832 RepID=A0A553NB13_TIGCA|nr:inner nuclear membrane protein Man1-like [Tigriopus californicus]TRY62605.1 hypothetical protein TCAL_03996 [Tigriopus californicus]|eukprot:TCALIF_03996-PA protein Name:"Similar to LEMD3 Inner nuclear membrane protein Man1 (Homo sapiens)" AED:0.00 eAED:0.00 QI:477/1/1/1/1/1/3/551/776